MRKIFSTMLSSLIVCMLMSVSAVQSVRTSGTIYTGVEGSVEGTDAHALQDATGLAEVSHHLRPWRKQDQYLDLIEEQDCSNVLVIGVDHTRPAAYDELVFLIAENGGRVTNTVSIGEKVVAVATHLPHKITSRVTAEIESRQLSRFIEPNVGFQTSFVPNDPHWSQQWGSAMIEADWAWNTTLGDPSVLVAVVDTGIYYNHNDLWRNYVQNGYDWVNDDPDPLDDNGHGTHCAGIIAALTDNSIGIAGTAQVSIMAEKGLSASGSGNSSVLANCIIHAVDQGADIISMSWGGLENSQVLHEAIKYAYNAGVLLVAAAGNEGWSIRHYPAAYSEVVAVTATDQLDDPASFTNFGDWVELAAPGVGIYSSFPPNSYVSMRGTSMAAPYVSGVGALIWSQFPTITRDQVRSQLRRSANDLGDSGFDEFFGYGRINAKNGVEQTLPDHDLLFLKWNATRYAKPGDLMSFNATVHNFGMKDENNVEVQLLIDGAIRQASLISFLPSGESAEISFSWSSTVEGTFNATLNLTPVLHESIVENNVLTSITLVRLEEVIYVPTDFPKIRHAINTAESGFTIYVSPGDYQENLAICKPLTLVGEDPLTTFINGNGRTAFLVFSTVNSSVSGFTIRNSEVGIYMLESSDGVVSNNRLLNNTSGIILASSGNNTLRGNNMSANMQNFGIVARSLDDFINNVDSSNKVNGKPVYYWVNQKNMQVPINAGFVALVNSTDVVVKDLDLTENYQGLLLAYTNNSVVDNVKVSDNRVGVESWRSNNNSLSNLSILDNLYGIATWNSNNNVFSNISISGSINGVESWYSHENSFFKIDTDDNWFGIVLYYCNRSTLSDNLASNSLGSYILLDSRQSIVNNSVASNGLFGIALGGNLGGSSGNIVTNNRVDHNIMGLIVEAGSYNNTLRQNRVLSNQVGIFLWNSRNNTILENTIQDNSLGLECRYDSNILHHNNIINNEVQLTSSFSQNVWDDGYPSGGNYWSDNIGVNRYKGINQDEPGWDYICDDPYVIDDDNQDNYPLVTPWASLKGDMNNDRKVDIQDIIIAVATYGLKPGDQNWNPFADLAPKWWVVDIYDIVTVAYHYGESW